VKTVTTAIAATKHIDVVRTLAIASSILWPNLDSIPDSIPYNGAPAAHSDAMAAPQAPHLLESFELSRAFPTSFWPLGSRASTMRPIGLPFLTCRAVTVT